MYGRMMGASAPIAGSTGPCSRGRAAEAPRITEVLGRVLEAIGRVSDHRPEAALGAVAPWPAPFWPWCYGALCRTMDGVDFVRLNRWLGLIGQADELFRFTHGAEKAMCRLATTCLQDRWLMAIFCGRVSGLLGIIRCSTPSLSSAATLPESTSSGSEKVRLKVPKERSWE